MTTLVTGATGNTGRHVVAELVRRGEDVRALTRDPAAAAGIFAPAVRLVPGTHGEPTTLAAALDGVDRLHVTVTAGLAEVGPELVRTAVAAGVSRITVLWGGYVGPVEQAVAESGVTWTRLEPQEFMSNTLTWAHSIRAEGVVREAFDHPSALVHEGDIGAVAAVALLEDGHGGQAYNLTGPEALTPAQRIARCPLRSGTRWSWSGSRVTTPSNGWWRPGCPARTRSTSWAGTPTRRPRPPRRTTPWRVCSAGRRGRSGTGWRSTPVGSTCPAWPRDGTSASGGGPERVGE